MMSYKNKNKRFTPQRRDNDAKKYCVALGCKNKGKDLQSWKKSNCPSHQKKSQSLCGCPFPFSLYPFPNTPKLQRIWLQRIGLPDLKINQWTNVCSIHFVEGKPTSRSYFPTLYLQPDLSDDEDNQCDIEMENPDYLTSESEMEPKSEFAEFNYDAEGGESHAQTLDDNDNELEPNQINIIDELDIKDEEGHFVKKEGTSSGTTDFIDNQGISDQNYLNDTEDESDIEVVFQAPRKPPPIVPVASYDPAAQTLQISNPVKYIIECHNRIAQLVADNTKLKADHAEEIKLLKTQNAILKRRLQSSKRFPVGIQKKPKK